MLKINIQLFGGRGASSGSGSWASGGGGIADIISTTSLVSAREGNQTEVDETLQTFKDMNDEYGYIAEDLHLATMGASDADTLAYYDGSNIAFNQAYFDKAKMEGVYAKCVKSGFHPSQGNKTALQAVASHEIGHALTDATISKMGKSLGKKDGAEAILDEARKGTRHKSNPNMASKISGYAKTSARECIAEAVADVYCNGKKARKESQAIVNVMNKYLK